MAVKISPIWIGQQFFNSAGQPLSGGKIYQYTAGTTTLTATYTDSTGTTPNANPIILDSAGRYSAQIWFTAGTNYKLVLTDSTGTTILTEDNLTGVNDAVSTGVSEWVTSGLTPTYTTGGNTFTVPGNQTSIFTAGRRVQLVDSGTTYYASVTSSSGTGPTTIVVSMDSGTLDSGLTVVNYALLGETNPSVPANIIYPISIKGSSTNDSASSGYIGEYVTNQAATVSQPTSGTNINVTSISLTSGDWDVSGSLVFNIQLGVGSSGTVGWSGGLSTTSLTFDSLSLASYGDPFQTNSLTIGVGTYHFTSYCPPRRLSISSTTTVYLVAAQSWTTAPGSPTATIGGFISARRRR